MQQTIQTLLEEMMKELKKVSAGFGSIDVTIRDDDTNGSEITFQVYASRKEKGFHDISNECASFEEALKDWEEKTNGKNEK